MEILPPLEAVLQTRRWMNTGFGRYSARTGEGFWTTVQLPFTAGVLGTRFAGGICKDWYTCPTTAILCASASMFYVISKKLNCSITNYLIIVSLGIDGRTSHHLPEQESDEMIRYWAMTFALTASRQVIFTSSCFKRLRIPIVNRFDGNLSLIPA